MRKFNSQNSLSSFTTTSIMQKGKYYIPLTAGIIFFAIVLWLNPFGLNAKAAPVFAIAVLMITWWVTEALPMPVVALLPLILFPLFGIAKMEDAASPYANSVIFLFMGGFMIGLAIEKWSLHKRIALSIVRLTGTSGNRIVLGFILATGFMSMWLSNTATTMMMYPIAISVIHVMETSSKTKGNLNNLSVCLLLAIAYASNFGGIATIIGTPPNVAYIAFLEKHNGYTFQFIDWMKLCFPISVILLFCLYIVMTKWLYPNNIKHDAAAKEMIGFELKQMGKLSKAEMRVLIVFATTALLWITKDIINAGQTSFKLDDTMIAVIGAVLLFIIPSSNDNSKFLLEWQDTKKMAWGILLLFGGGISLANQLEKAGLIQSLGNWMSGFATGGFLLVLIVATVSIFISEVMSNVAQVIVFAPVVAGMSEALRIDPLQIGVAMTLGASCASMLPMGTPPNAIVFASGRLKLKDMTTTGFVMNIISAILITLFCWYLLPVLVKAIH
jgi:solute carrier family 13 (sodium-dependent dicarboxylate transporter), member 2/3/5